MGRETLQKNIDAKGFRITAVALLGLAAGSGQAVADTGTAAFRYNEIAGSVEVSLSGGAYEALVRASRQVATGAGLQGGGTLANDRTLSVATNGITNAMLRQSAATSVVGRSANSTGDVADIAASADGQFLRRASGVLAFGAITLADLPATVVDTSGLGANQIAVGTDANTLGSSNQATWDATTGAAVFTGPTATDATLTVRRPDATGGALYFGNSGHGIRRGSSAPGADNDITFYSAGFSAFRYYASGSEVAHVSYEGRVRAGDGSLAAPAFSFKDQTALGFYRDASMRMGVTGSMQFVTENSGLIVDAAGFRRVGLMKYGGREAGVWLAAGQDFELGHVDVADLLGSISSFTVRWRVTDTEIQQNLQTKVRAATSNGATTLALRGYQTGSGAGTGAHIDLGYNDADVSVARIAGFFDGAGPAFAILTGASNTVGLAVGAAGLVTVGSGSANGHRLHVEGNVWASGNNNGSPSGSGVGLKYVSSVGYLECASWGTSYRGLNIDSSLLAIRIGTSSPSEVARFSGSGNLLVGTTADVAGERVTVAGGGASVTLSDATTNAAATMLTLRKTTSGTAAAGLGVRMNFDSASSTGVARTQASIASSWLSATNGSENADLSFTLRAGGTNAIGALRLAGIAGGSSQVLVAADGTFAVPALAFDASSGDGIGFYRADTDVISAAGRMRTTTTTLDADVLDVRLRNSDSTVKSHWMVFRREDGSGGLVTPVGRVGVTSQWNGGEGSPFISPDRLWLLGGTIELKRDVDPSASAERVRFGFNGLDGVLSDGSTTRWSLKVGTGTNGTNGRDATLVLGGSIAPNTTAAALYVSGNYAASSPANTFTWDLFSVGGNCELASAGSPSNLRMASFRAPNITNTTTSMTPTLVSTVYIEGAPVLSGGTAGSLYSFFVDGGIARFDGNGSHVFELPADATGNATAATGRIPIRVGGVTKYLRYFDS